MAKKKILVIDDDPVTTKLVRLKFEANGFNVITSDNGSEGVEKAGDEKPDLVILDIKMPKMDGYSTLRALREKEKTKSIPVIILTAHPKMKDLFEVEQISDYVVKPFDVQNLLSKASRILNQELKP